MKHSTSSAPLPVMLNTGDRLVRFDLSELAYLEVDRDYCNLYMADGITHFTICQPMGHIQRLLPEDCFVRISRFYIVNTHHIESKEGNRLHLDGRRTPITITETYRNALDGKIVIFGGKSSACAEEVGK